MKNKEVPLYLNNIICQCDEITVSGGFRWAYKKQNLQSFFSALLQARRDS